jgi:hypothetical protein
VTNDLAFHNDALISLVFLLVNRNKTIILNGFFVMMTISLFKTHILTLGYKTEHGNQSQISSIRLAEMATSRHFNESDVKILDWFPILVL